MNASSGSPGGSNPEYVTARVRARRGVLFDDDEYSKLVRMGPAEIARYMEESEYEREINELGSRHSGVDLIEYSLNRNLARHFDALLGFAEGQLYDLIARYLRKFDAWNVKTVLRGVYTDADSEAIETDMIRAGEFDDALITRLLEAGTVEDVVSLLDGTIFGDGLEAAFEDFQETDTLVPLENAVDRAFYEQLLSDLPSGEAVGLYREFLEAEIDFRNVRNALRLARSGADIDPGAYFIDGGRLFSASEMTTLVENTDELVTRIRESRYGKKLSEPLDELEAADSLIDFERALEGVLLRYSKQLGNVHPLSICPVVAYILMKEREVTNIRAIARGREAGLSETAIEQELVIL
ncbi:V-type ATP synthase subunit C [Halonotius roseus]|uniref:A-type ATP synthase subunit C n=1 Tax=Halonotius roseus TaxID=2511997 RepID=A0A544QSX2_9EURY|nr:V-type ATP synthase subunit C [Halonotius roseus]TQQ82529.1 V-type ATP synthase subunit C [Halonotius roseus]